MKVKIFGGGNEIKLEGEINEFLMQNNINVRHITQSGEPSGCSEDMTGYTTISIWYEDAQL